MRALVVPVLLLVPIAAAVMIFSGLEGVSMVALMSAFLMTFALLLFRTSAARSGLVDTPANERTAADREFLAFLVLAAAFTRVVLALGLRNTGLHLVIAPDEETFDVNARIFLAWLNGDYAHPFSYRWEDSTQVGYFVLVGFIYKIFGVFPVLPVLLNCVAGAFCAVPAFRVASRIGGRSAGRLSAVFVAFFPSLVLWSSLLLRDSFAMLVILWAAAHAQSLLERFGVRRLIWLVFCLAILATLRSYLFLLVGASVGLGFLVAGVRRPGRALATAVLGTLAVIALVRGLGLGTDYLSMATLEGVAERRQLNAVGTGGIELGGHDLSTPMGAITYLPIGIAWFLFSPFPWQIAGKQALAIPDVLIWYVMVPFVVSGALYGLRSRRRAALVPLLIGGGITMLYALVEGNVGIIFRHRAQVLVIFLPFAAVAFARRRRTKARRRQADLARQRKWLQVGLAGQGT